MERVNGNNTVDIGGGRRGFRSQNAIAGIAGTEVTANFLNDIQEELSAVIEKSGLVLDPQDQEQLYKALMRMVAPGFGNRVAWLPVLSVTVTAPPASPTLGDAYIIPAGATGVWAGKAQQLTEWNGTSWNVTPTKDGHGVGLPDGRVFERVSGVYVEILASRDWVNTRKTPLTQLNSLSWLTIKSMTLATPPAIPSEGDAYLIAASPTGAWAGRSGQIAEWSNGVWVFKTAADGHGISLPDGRVFERVSGTYIEKLALDAQSGKWSYTAASGSESALLASLSPPPQELAVGLRVYLKVSAANTGPVTLNLNGLGIKNIVYAINGAPLNGSDYEASALIELLYDGTAWRLMGISQTRIKLTAPRTFYVATTGNDTIGTGASDKPWKTIQKAINTAIANFDWGGNDVTIKVADGTYAGFGVAQTTPNGNLAITGNLTTPTNCILNGANPVLAERYGSFSIGGFRIAPTSGSSLSCYLGGMINITGAMDFAAALSGSHIFCHDRAIVLVNANYTVSGSAQMHLDVQGTGAHYLASSTINVTGNPSFSISFAYSSLGAQLLFTQGSMITGTATGARYQAHHTGIISLAGAGINFFPGSSVGWTSNGGIYV